MSGLHRIRRWPPISAISCQEYFQLLRKITYMKITRLVSVIIRTNMAYKPAIVGYVSKDLKIRLGNVVNYPVIHWLSAKSIPYWLHITISLLQRWLIIDIFTDCFNVFHKVSFSPLCTCCIRISIYILMILWMNSLSFSGPCHSRCTFLNLWQ